MNIQTTARQRFRALIQQTDTALNLAETALCIAWEDQGQGDPLQALQQLDSIAQEGHQQIAEITDPHQIITTLNSYLFEHLGFHGNTWDYHDPQNSFLDRVLETRTGLPIILSVIYMEIAWRLSLPVSGLALPGHFLVRYAEPQTELFIDPFNQGRLWSRSECEQQITKVYGHVTPSVVQSVMEPPSRRAILVRILRNLKHAYLASANFAQALAAVERILLLLPHDTDEVRDRGLLHFRLGAYHQALEDLEQYATLAPTAADLPEIQKYAQTLAEQLAYGN